MLPQKAIDLIVLQPPSQQTFELVFVCYTTGGPIWASKVHLKDKFLESVEHANVMFLCENFEISKIIQSTLHKYLHNTEMWERFVKRADCLSPHVAFQWFGARNLGFPGESAIIFHMNNSFVVSFYISAAFDVHLDTNSCGSLWRKF